MVNTHNVLGAYNSGQLIKAIQLTSAELMELKGLIAAATAADNYAIKVYWQALKNRQLQSYNDFLYYQENQLVGYIGLFHFKAALELTAVVHPDYRRQRIFSQLLQAAVTELTKIGLTH